MAIEDFDTSDLEASINKDKLRRIEGMIDLAYRWSEDQLLEDSSIAVTTINSIARVIKE